MLDTNYIHIGASIGIVLNAEKYNDIEDVLRDADIAMYRCKADRSQVYCIFSEEMREELPTEVSFERALKQAVSGKHFFVEYQPIVNIQSPSIKVFEALVRWKRGSTVLLPEEFLDVAEELGIIGDIGKHVFESVCKQIARWRTISADEFIVHVNISSSELRNKHLYKEVAAILEEYQVPTKFLRFEIVQAALLNNNGDGLTTVQALRDIGIEFCLDDFSIGTSSFSYLLHFPLDCIKIDRGFIKELEHNVQHQALLRDAISLSADLNLQVLTEGIEKRWQRELLESLGCVWMQGFYFAMPLSAEAAEAYLLHKEG